MGQHLKEASSWHRLEVEVVRDKMADSARPGKAGGKGDVCEGVRGAG